MAFPLVSGADLLTAREVQDLLKIDRTTIYRMLKDGRLAGVKVGHQWRFPRHEVDTLLAGEAAAAVAEGEPGTTPEESPLPVHCVQPIQDLFAAMAGVGVIALSPSGTPITRPSGPFRPASRHLHDQGLAWATAEVTVNGAHAATLVAGPFRAAPGASAEPGDEATPQLDERGRARLDEWLRKAAYTFEAIGHERAVVQDRMRRIAALTSFSVPDNN